MNRSSATDTIRNGGAEGVDDLVELPPGGEVVGHSKVWAKAAIGGYPPNCTRMCQAIVLNPRGALR